jgi:hypothetical protein
MDHLYPNKPFFLVVQETTVRHGHRPVTEAHMQCRCAPAIFHSLLGRHHTACFPIEKDDDPWRSLPFFGQLAEAVRRRQPSMHVSMSRGFNN